MYYKEKQSCGELMDQAQTLMLEYLSFFSGKIYNFISEI